MVSKRKKLGYIRSNKLIPMCNVFNRTSFFVPLRKKDYNKVVDKDNAIKFKNKTYELMLYNYKLNHSYDYPMLALIIKHWVNKIQFDSNTVKINLSEVDTVKINLSEVTDLLNKNYPQSRQKNYDPIISSLNRLSKVKVCLSEINYKGEKLPSSLDGTYPIITYQKMFFDSKPKYIEVGVSELIKTIYAKIFNITFLDFTLIDVEKIVDSPSESSKALLKFFMSHSYDYIDFKLEPLENLLGFKYRTPPLVEKNSRKKIKTILDELIDSGFLTAYKTNKERSWDRVRIIPTTLCDSLEIVNEVIDLLNSNFNMYRYNPVIDDEREMLKAKARFDLKIRKYGDLMLLLASLE